MPIPGGQGQGDGGVFASVLIILGGVVVVAGFIGFVNLFLDLLQRLNGN